VRKDIIKKNIRKMQEEMGDNYWRISASGIWFQKIFRELLNKYSSGKLLDAGAGNLLYKEMLSDYCTEYESLDITDNPNLDYQQDIKDMELDSETYDTVFCRNVLEHVEKPQYGIKEISRVLKEDGKAIISVPHLAYLHNEPHDYYRFTKYSLKHMSEEAGLEVVEIREAGGLFSFIGYIFSTAFMGLTYHIPVVSKISYYINKIFQFTVVKLDKITGNASLIPLNYIIVLKKIKAR